MGPRMTASVKLIISATIHYLLLYTAVVTAAQAYLPLFSKSPSVTSHKKGWVKKASLGLKDFLVFEPRLCKVKKLRTNSFFYE